MTETPSFYRDLADYAMLLRERDGSSRVAHDRHLEGLFPRATWLELIDEAGFDAAVVPLEHSELEPGAQEVFVCTRRVGLLPDQYQIDTYARITRASKPYRGSSPGATSVTRASRKSS
jgi:hypothetical protein